MHIASFRRRCTAALRAVAAAALVLGARGAAAQAWFYPSFQVPEIAERDYTFAVVGAGGADFLFQWREQMSSDNQLSLDAGLADPKGTSNTKLLIGGQFARSVFKATDELPLDMLFTVGAGVAAGDGPDLFRIPVGLSVGHRFELDNEMTVMPYVHPRLSLDVATGKGSDRTNLSVDFDLGASITITPKLALRGSIVVSGNSAASDAGVGIGLTYTPAGLRSR
ncbi:MAG: hypothetical protein JO180_00865 [Gemmatirosa sp.]|nr:hypothetical protein [Gemmatirosa sp.]